VEEVNSTTQSKDFANHLDEFLHFGQLNSQRDKLVHASTEDLTSKVVVVDKNHSTASSLKQP
jgi:hypothetical protein